MDILNKQSREEAALKRREDADKSLEEDGHKFDFSTSERRLELKISVGSFYELVENGVFFNEESKYLKLYRGRYREVVPIGAHVPKRASRYLTGFTFTLNQKFQAVVKECAKPRSSNDKKWIGPVIKKKLASLHAEGKAHSVEIYENNRLVAGIMGVQSGSLFVSFSTFRRVDSAGNAAFIVLQRVLEQQGFTIHDVIAPSQLSRHNGGTLLPIHQYDALKRTALRRDAVFPSVSFKTPVI